MNTTRCLRDYRVIPCDFDLRPICDRSLTPSGDTILHSWEVLVQILQSEEAKGIVCDIGMWVTRRHVLLRRLGLL